MQPLLLLPLLVNMLKKYNLIGLVYNPIKLYFLSILKNVLFLNPKNKVLEYQEKSD